jgi:hypothetical protein
MHPPAAFGVVEAEHLGQGPVDVSSEIGRLLPDPVQGVAGYSPGGGSSTSCGRPQCGHSTASVRAVRPLIRL